MIAEQNDLHTALLPASVALKFGVQGESFKEPILQGKSRGNGGGEFCLHFLQEGYPESVSTGSSSL